MIAPSSLLFLLSLSLLRGISSARNVPSNLRNLYNTLKSNGTCSNKDGTSFVNMDIDCDGTQGSPADDKHCYKKGIRDLDANIHRYVVFGNTGKKSGWKTFDPQKHGIKLLSLMAVVCEDQLIYGIWGDMNGDDGPHPMVGEASTSLATACYGKKHITGDNGHDQDNVLYIAFTGDDAVPGANGANWAATNYKAFESSI
ncbi:family 75 glycoside hydrolase [Podospora didyma]|uniref:Endo-chitosanase n=1 Tax=Podospora didyma TaxID=330526 RepID=A0AAE0U742_9PEZI|nr:family 75 glycoside hydrolase [Podospora didyma]